MNRTSVVALPVVVAAVAAAVAAVAPTSFASGKPTTPPPVTATDVQCATPCVSNSEITDLAWSKLTGVPSDQDTTYTAGTGLALSSSNVFSVYQVPWSSLTSVPTGLGDGDDNTTYSAGSGLTLSGNTFSANAPNWNSLTNIPSDIADGDQNTTYAAGTGLDLTGTTFALEPAGVTATQLAAGAATTDKQTANAATGTSAPFTLDTVSGPFNANAGTSVSLALPGASGNHLVSLTGQFLAACGPACSSEANVVTVQWQIMDSDGTTPISPSYAAVLTTRSTVLTGSVSFIASAAAGTAQTYRLRVTANDPVGVPGQPVTVSGALLNAVDLGRQ